MKLPSYPSIFALGHKCVRDLMLEPVTVQEKIDGSQISFGVMPVGDLHDDPGTLCIRSKGAEIYVEAPDKMFAPAVAQVQSRVPLLTKGWIYRGEFLGKPKHNVLAYDRVPKDNIILFDVDQGGEMFLSDLELVAESARIGFECVPTFHRGMISDAQTFRDLLAMKSILGGQLIEGVVIKNYARVGIDKHTLMAKFVSEAFKEVHAGEWRAANPSRADVVETLIARLRTPARWQKAVQHLREAGQIADAPKDIGLLFREVPLDIAKEEKDRIAETLWAHFWPQISRGCTAGLAEWYKDELVKKQFEVAA